MQAATLQLHDHLEYPEAGSLSKVLLKDANCQYTLFCLAADTEISEHTAPRNATVYVLVDQGTLTLAEKGIAQIPGTFVVMPAHALAQVIHPSKNTYSYHHTWTISFSDQVQNN